MVQVTLHPPQLHGRQVHFWVGYIFWQLSQVYADLYQHHAKQVGIYQHKFTDLTFTSATIDAQGWMKVAVDSYQRA